MANLSPEQWLAAMPLAAIEEKITSLEAEKLQLDAALGLWRAARVLHFNTLQVDTVVTRSPSPTSAPGPTPTPAATSIPPPPTLRQAVLRLLAEQPGPKQTSSIRKALIQRGWMRDDPTAANNLYAMISTMTKKGQLVRRIPGVYELSQEEQDALNERTIDVLFEAAQGN